MSGIKRLEREAHHSLPFSAGTKNVWSYKFTRLYVFMVWCLIKQGIHLYGAELR